ncbi:MAG: rhomboid family intramembrane serine protease [Chloroflexota bacterium]|nr:MAG: rhomboid family intramembrane serine protease [Chloroflexota bacterium]
MIPIKTLQPVRSKAYVTYGLIAINSLVFLWLLTQSQQQLGQTFYALSAVPCEISRNFLSVETLLDLFRSMFLHGSWPHLVGNMTYLWIFGRNAEDYFGHRRFLALYVGAGLLAALVEIMVNAGLCVPMVGASGAIAGVLGSYLLLYPGSRVRIMIIFFRFFPRFYNIPALVVLGLWFVIQLFNGIASLGAATLGGGVAFFAHIGGFVAGLIITFIYLMFNPPPDRTIYLS